MNSGQVKPLSIFVREQPTTAATARAKNINNEGDAEGIHHFCHSRTNLKVDPRVLQQLDGIMRVHVLAASTAVSQIDDR